MTEPEEALGRWYHAGNTDEFQKFFEVLVRELELFRHVHPGHVFRPNDQRFERWLPTPSRRWFRRRHTDHLVAK
jgi:hypothetical protein